MKLYTIDWRDLDGNNLGFRGWLPTLERARAVRRSLIKANPHFKVEEIQRHHIAPPVNARSVAAVLNVIAGRL